MTFFVDRSLGRSDVARALRSAGYQVVHHDSVFAADTPDLTWLRVAARRAWIVLSKDAQLRYPPERDLIVKSGLHVFVVTNAQLTGGAMARLLVERSDRIEQYAASRAGGYVVGVYVEAPRLRRLYPVRGRGPVQRRRRG